MKRIKVAFLDRDGTIIKDYDEKQWSNVKLPELLDGTIEALKQIKNMQYEIIIITNQEIINKGIISLGEYYNFTNKLLEILKKEGVNVLDILYCPHKKEEKCNCKKPKPGMILQACKKYNINLEKSFVVGDTSDDEGIAEYFDMKFFGMGYYPKNKRNKRVNNILEILDYIKE